MKTTMKKHNRRLRLGLLGCGPREDGSVGVNGTVSDANSLVGSNRFDRVGADGVTPLSNGN
jgi:hypothetical protein